MPLIPSFSKLGFWGWSFFGVVALSLSSCHHSGGVFSGTPSPHLVSAPLVYKFSQDSEFTAAQRQCMAVAMKIWSKVVGKELFRKGHVPHGVPLEFSKVVLEDARLHPRGTLAWAVTRLRRVGGGFRLVYAHIFFNAFYLQHHHLKGDGHEAFLSSVLHELGHVLGLTHVSTHKDRDSVMHPRRKKDSPSLLPSLGDIKRLHHLYGCSDLSCDLEKLQFQLRKKEFSL